MKKLCHLFIASLLLTLTFFVLSCSNGSSSDGDSDAGRIYLASPYAGLSDYMKKTVQMTKLTASEKIESIPKVFLVKGSDLANMSEANMLLAVETCAEGNTFVVDAPTQAQVKAFKTKLDSFLDKSENEYYNALQDVHLYSIDNLLLHFIDADSGTMGAFEAIAMRKTQVYFVHDIDEVYTVDYSGAESADTDNKWPVKDTQIKESDLKNVTPEDIKTDYTILFDESAENFASWIKLIDSVEPVAQGGVNLNDAKKAQSFVHNFTATFSSNRSHYDGRYNGKSENVQVYVDVWSACDIDKKTDHYLVRTSCVCNNQQLGYANQWDSSKYVGPFFEYAHVTTKIEKASLASNDCSPQTSTGSTSFATSEGFSLSGNIGFNASGPTGGIGATYSHTETTTRSIPDISIALALDAAGNSATWKYTTPEVDASWSGLVTKCDGAKSIQYNTAIFDTYAHYTMPSAEYYSQEKFPLVTTTKVSIRMLTGWLDGFLNSTLHTGWASRWTSKQWTDYVRKPSNSFRNYIMAFEPPSSMSTHDREILANALKVYISDWGNSVRYYGIINTNKPDDKTNLDKIAKSHFAIAKKTIENNTKVLKDRGFSGTFKFYIKPEDATAELTSFTITF